MKGIIIIVLILFPLHVFAQPLSRKHAELFVRALIEDGEALDDFVDAADMHMAQRLGIRYEGVRHKYLISYDIDESVKSGIRQKGLAYEIAVQSLGHNYSKLLLSVPEIDYHTEFFFRGPNLVSRISYLTRGWRRWKSAHFVFCLSDTTLFNQYCIDNLERFFEEAAGVLAFGDEELETIEREKIHYFLCSDGEEIKLLTGYHARGMYIVAYDFIVTTFNAHYHELMHLFINYKLREAPLYTHPFLLEGFAVAFGGRGGREPDVILRLGSFLYESGMADYTAMLAETDFNAVDASISYPASGLYNLFLVRSLGIERYLDLYRRYGGTAAEVDRMRIPEDALPGRPRWREYLDSYSATRPIDFSEPPEGAHAIHVNDAVRVSGDAERYYFSVRDTVLIGGAERQDGFRSGIYEEIVGDGDYRGEKYLITAGEGEISIYNLYTNNLITNHVASFTVPFTPVPSADGFHHFSVRFGVFDETLTTRTSVTVR